MRSILLVGLVLLAGCAAPAADTSVDPPAPRVGTVEHFGCSLQIGFFTLPEADVRARLPEGFEPVLQQDALGREGARSFVVAYGCDDAAIDGARTGEPVAEMGFAFAVEPPIAYASDSASHWIASWITGSPAIAEAYGSWSLGRAGEVTHARSPAGEAGENRAMARVDDASYAFTSRNTAGFVDLAEDTLRLMSLVDGRVDTIVDLVVLPTQGGAGFVSYRSDDTSFYPATSIDDQGFHESWTDKAWTFTRIDLPVGGV